MATPDQRASDAAAWLKSPAGQRAQKERSRQVAELKALIAEAMQMGNRGEARDLQQQMSKLMQKNLREFGASVTDTPKACDTRTIPAGAIRPQARPSYNSRDTNSAFTAAVQMSAFHKRPIYILVTNRGWVMKWEKPSIAYRQPAFKLTATLDGDHYTIVKDDLTPGGSGPASGQGASVAAANGGGHVSIRTEIAGHPVKRTAKQDAVIKQILNKHGAFYKSTSDKDVLFFARNPDALYRDLKRVDRDVERYDDDDLDASVAAGTAGTAAPTIAADAVNQSKLTIQQAMPQLEKLGYQLKRGVSSPTGPTKYVFLKDGQEVTLDSNQIKTMLQGKGASQMDGVAGLEVPTQLSRRAKYMRAMLAGKLGTPGDQPSAVAAAANPGNSGSTRKHMDHAEYQRRLKSKTPDELRYIIKDATEAARANPQGENAGYYQDEALYAQMELKKRGVGAAHMPNNGSVPDRIWTNRPHTGTAPQKAKAAAITSKNQEHGFYNEARINGMADKLLASTFNRVASTLVSQFKLTPQQARDFLDSRDGRHLADAMITDGNLGPMPAWLGSQVKRFLKQYGPSLSASQAKAAAAAATGSENPQMISFLKAQGFKPNGPYWEWEYRPQPRYVATRISVMLKNDSSDDRWWIVFPGATMTWSGHGLDELTKKVLFLKKQLVDEDKRRHPQLHPGGASVAASFKVGDKVSYPSPNPGDPPMRGVIKRIADGRATLVDSLNPGDHKTVPVSMLKPYQPGGKELPFAAAGTSVMVSRAQHDAMIDGDSAWMKAAWPKLKRTWGIGGAIVTGTPQQLAELKAKMQANPVAAKPQKPFKFSMDDKQGLLSIVQKYPNGISNFQLATLATGKEATTGVVNSIMNKMLEHVRSGAVRKVGGMHGGIIYKPNGGPNPAASIAASALDKDTMDAVRELQTVWRTINKAIASLQNLSISTGEASDAVHKTMAQIERMAKDVDFAQKQVMRSGGKGASAIAAGINPGTPEWTNAVRSTRGKLQDAAVAVSQLVSQVDDQAVKQQVIKADGLLGSVRQILFNIQ